MESTNLSPILLEAQRELQRIKARKRWEKLTQEQKNDHMAYVRSHKRRKALDTRNDVPA